MEIALNQAFSTCFTKPISGTGFAVEISEPISWETATWTATTMCCADLSNSLGIQSPKLRMVSWNLNTLRFGGDYTPQSSFDVRWATIPTNWYTFRVPEHTHTGSVILDLFNMIFVLPTMVSMGIIWGVFSPRMSGLWNIFRPNLYFPTVPKV